MLQKEIAGKNILFATDNYKVLTYDEYEFLTFKSVLNIHIMLAFSERDQKGMIFENDLKSSKNNIAREYFCFYS